MILSSTERVLETVSLIAISKDSSCSITDSFRVGYSVFYCCVGCSGGWFNIKNATITAPIKIKPVVVFLSMEINFEDKYIFSVETFLES